MSRMSNTHLVSSLCPRCGYLNRHELREMFSPQAVTCDGEKGGCNECYFVSFEINIVEVRTYVLKQAGEEDKNV